MKKSVKTSVSFARLDPPPRQLHADSRNCVTEAIPSQIDHPPHYTIGRIEVIDAIEDWKLDYHLGNVVKYVARANHKGDRLSDLKKAMWYLQRVISKESGQLSLPTANDRRPTT